MLINIKSIKCETSTHVLFFLDVNVKYQDQNFSSVLIKTKISLWSEILNNLFCTKWMGFQGHGNYNPKLIYIKYNFTKLML